MIKGGSIPNWNTYSPKWAPIAVADFPDAKNKSIQLTDEDPYDYARAIRVFKETTKADLRFRLYAGQNNHGELSVDITDRYGNRPVRISLTERGEMEVMNGNKPVKIGMYKPGAWYDFRVVINASLNGSFDLFLNGKKVLSRAALAEAVKSVERISFRTGAYRDIPNRTTPNEVPEPPLRGADVKAAKAVYFVDDVVAGEY